MPPLLAWALFCVVLASSALPAPSVELRAVAHVSTRGAAGFEAFVVTSPSGVNSTFLAVANFWDGVSGDMSAVSDIYRVDEGDGASLSLTLVDSFTTQGAHGFDAFAVRDRTFLVVPGYYACGSTRGPATGPCASTAVLEHGVDGRFGVFQTLLTSGPAQTDHLVTRDGTAFVIVGENFRDAVCLYRLISTDARGGDGSFVRHECHAVAGAGGIAVAEIGAFYFLTMASYHDGATGWATRSIVRRARVSSPGALLTFAGDEVQRIDTHGAHDVEVATLLGGVHLLFLSEDRSAEDSRIDSALLEWVGGAYRVVQRVPTDGAHAAELFEGPDGDAFLAVACFGDRLGGRTAARSGVWRRQQGIGDPSAGVPPPRFELVADVDSWGATDFEHFVYRGRHFLALSNEGDVGTRAHQTSVVYELVLDGGAVRSDL